MKRYFILTANALVGEVGTTFNLPNYEGALYTANRQTTFLNMLGGVNAGLTTPNKEFATAQLFDLPSPSQPAISENQSVQGVEPTHVARRQEKNVTQIFQEAIDISYVKLANAGRLQGINSEPAKDIVADERDFQITQKLKKIARDLNYVFHNGQYHLAATADEADKTRGMLQAIETLGGAVIDAATNSLTKTIVDSLFKLMFNNGATFTDVVLFAGADVKVQISEIYGFAPQDRNIGGINIKQIETDFGTMGVALDPDVPNGTLAAYDLAYISPVFQTVPGKGNLFYEPLAKTGASEKGQVFGLIGLDHAPAFLHGKVINIG